MKVGDLMKRVVHACRLEGTLNDAAQMMWEHGIGAAPVVSEGGYVVGFITDRDVCMGAYTTGRKLADVPITESMSREVIACRAADKIDVAERLMRQHRVRRLPVVDEAGRLAGVLSIDDLAAHLDAGVDFGVHPLGGNAIATTLAATCDRTPAPSAPPAHGRP